MHFHHTRFVRKLSHESGQRGGVPLQRALHRGGEIQTRLLVSLIEIVKDLGRSVYGPNCLYFEAKPIEEQIKILMRYSWNRVMDWELNEVQQSWIANPAPINSEGYFAIVIHETMFFNHDVNPKVNYWRPFKQVLQTLKKSRNGQFQNMMIGELNHKNYRRTLENTRGLRELWEAQGCPESILLIPAQLGIRFKGRSVQEVRSFMKDKEEFGLSGYEVAQILLTHLGLLQDDYDLKIDCVGDEFSPGVDSDFQNVPVFEFYGDKLRLSTYRFDAPCSFSGSVSGFIPK